MSKKPESGKTSSGLPGPLVPYVWKKGEVHGTKDLLVRRTQAASLLLSVLTLQDARGSLVNAQRWFDKVLQSEYLMGKLLDKMLPTLTPEQVNIIAGSFEQKILNMNGGDAPRADAPAVEEPTTEGAAFDAEAQSIVDAVGAGALPATPVVAKPTPKKGAG